MNGLLKKQYLLTGYLEYLMDLLNEQSSDKKLIDIITTRDPQQRGCQLSVTFSIPLEEIHQQIEKMGVLVMESYFSFQLHLIIMHSLQFQCDIRLPSVMRLAPVPLYNSFNDVHRFFTILKRLLEKNMSC